MNPFEGHETFETKRGVEFCLIDGGVNGSIIKVWKVRTNDMTESGVASAYKLDLLKTAVEVDVLKDIGVWGKLSKQVQDGIEGREKETEHEVHSRMAKARGKRKKKYTDLPEMLTCKCGAQVKANYSYLQKKADAKKIPLMDLVKGYQCQKCNPTKGRKKKK